MDHNQSLQLFSKHAFRRDSPLDEYIGQSYRAIRIPKGLPLPLEVIGSLLSRTKRNKWGDILKKLESVPHVEIQNQLKISLEALDVRQRHIFLDIACFFIGYDKDIVVYFWKSEFFPEEAIEVLQNMSLIKIEECIKVWMHDQLKDVGREIICQESKMKIKKQCRVWNLEDVSDFLRRHEEEKEVEALRLKFDHRHCFTHEDFKSLPNLTFLEVDDSGENCCAKEKLLWLEWLSNCLLINVFQKNSNLLPELRWLSWHNIDPTFKIANFSMENPHEGMLYARQHLKRTPNLYSHSNLERLILSGYESLIEIDRSICQLKCLVFLDVSYCGNLQRLPDELGGDLASLEYLSLRDCKSLKMLPETFGKMESLTDLDMSGTWIKELPDSIGKLKNLKAVEMWKIYPARHPHVEISNSIYGNKSIRILTLQNVRMHALPRLPESLTQLKLGDFLVDTLPDLSNLTDLKVLRLDFQPRDSDGKYHGLMEEPIPPWIGNLSKLESLGLRYFWEKASSTDQSLPPHPRRLPKLPSSLTSLALLGFHPLCSMDLTNLRKLSSLSISYSAVAEIESLGCLENLRHLYLQRIGQLATLPDLSKLNKLRRIRVSECDNLVKIQGEPPRFLDKFEIYTCPSLQELPDLFCLMGKTFVRINSCDQVLHTAWMCPQQLRLYGFKQMQILPDLSNLNQLRILQVRNCGNLVQIRDRLPQSLAYLEIESCESLQKLPDLSSLKGLGKVIIKRCGKLAVEEISQLCSEKSIEFVGEDDEEDKLPVWKRNLEWESGRASAMGKRFRINEARRFFEIYEREWSRR
ncbi:hypothetical protein ACJRO7_032278 [Eucalyptus globulus]|uniref:Uncharacterized protein n=1 Tax=Eucalyptus globulus TaxID=34317 RepID=A0ABD3JHD7_EUCGL